jgi:hypothetical protein
LLHLYARALDAAGEHRRAALHHLRCGLLHPTSPYAGPSLLRASQLHDEAFGDEEAALRLAERALTIAQAQRHADLIAACRTWMSEIEADLDEPAANRANAGQLTKEPE